MRQASLSHFLLGKFLLEYIGRIICSMKPSAQIYPEIRVWENMSDRSSLG